MAFISWNEQKKIIECELLITLPTSKIRVKRKGLEPVATRRESISNEDLIEWQISYIRNELLIEFGKILHIAYIENIVHKDDINLLIEKFKNAGTFEESYQISREITREEFNEFKVIYERTPILRYEFKDGCYIDIVLKHKQRAVGYQAMIYIYIPVKDVQPPLIGRTAKPKESVIWTPKQEHILGLLKVFLVASKKHRTDIINKVIPKLNYDGP